MGKKIILVFIVFLFGASTSFQCENYSQPEKTISHPKEQEWPPVVSLPVYPPLSNLGIRNSSYKKERPLKSITWQISKHSGTQFITRKEATSWFTAVKNGTVFPINSYKSILVTVKVKDIFLLNSNLTVGFAQGTMPLDFSQYTLPYEYSQTTSISSEFYVTKGFSTKKRTVLYPFAGHTFSRYLFEAPFSDEEKKFQAFVLGIAQDYSPSRLVSIRQGLLFSPVITQGYDDLLLFQFGYETEVKLSAGPFSLSLMARLRDNFQYKKDLTPADEISVAETGVKFSFNL